MYYQRGCLGSLTKAKVSKQGRLEEKRRGVTIAPFCGRLGPDDFQSAGDGVITSASAKTVGPAQVLLLKGGGFRLRARG